MDTRERIKFRIGFSRMEKQYQWKDHVIFMGLLLGLAVWLNHGIQIKGLYMDDLYFWSCYGEQSFVEYVFPMGSTRFRFLYYLAAWLEMAVVRNHVAFFVPINILLNAALSWYLYSIGWRLSRAKAIGFFTGAMFLASRMAYYQIGQVLGLMETMALWMAVSILWNLYRYINEENRENGFYFASLLYFGVCFVHERYMALLPLLILALIIKKCKKISLWFSTVLSFGLVQLIRAFTIGSVLPAGTGGTQVADTLNIQQAIKFAFSQAAYVFGINAGPEHLNGCPWGESPMWVKGLTGMADVMILIMVLAFLVKFIVEKQKERKFTMLFNAMLFIGFIALNIASSSVTIRVEMRWIYVSLAGALLFLSYIYGELTEGVKKELYLKRLWPWGILFGLYVLLMLPAELFYRSCYPKLYLWPDQLRYNSLAEQTYEKYGDSIFGKTIYIMGNTYQMSDFTARTFFKVFDPKMKAEGTKVEFIDSIRDIGQVDDQMLVLREDPAHNAFQDITDFVRSLKLQIDYGYYSDGWMDEHASLTVMAGSTGEIELEFMYPGVMSGGEAIYITKDKEPACTLPLHSSVVNTTLQAEPWQLVHLEFDYNFYMQNAREQRGEDRLAAIVHITTP